jgi:hypothetical protein
MVRRDSVDRHGSDLFLPIAVHPKGDVLSKIFRFEDLKRRDI